MMNAKSIYEEEQILFESATPGTYTLEIAQNGIYEVSCIAGGGRKFYVKDGQKYSHTVDPRTGYPVSHSLLSATIVAPDATLADAYATYCMVIGLEESRKFIESSEDIEGYLVYADGDSMAEWASSGFNLVRE